MLQIATHDVISDVISHLQSYSNNQSKTIHYCYIRYLLGTASPVGGKKEEEQQHVKVIIMTYLDLHGNCCHGKPYWRL